MEPNGAACDTVGELLMALEIARANGGHEALALADCQGILVAGAGAIWLCEELAAEAPFRASEVPANDIVPNRLEILGPTRVLRVRVDGVELLLCGRGGADRGLLAAASCARELLETKRVPSPASAGLVLAGALDATPQT